MIEPPDERATLADAMRALQVVADGSDTSWTVLHAAAAAGHLEASRFLLASGMPVGARDADGDTALHVAAQSGHEAVALALLAAGASRTAVGAFGHTPSRRAVLMGHERLARALRAQSPNPGTRTGRIRRWLRRLWRF